MRIASFAQQYLGQVTTAEEMRFLLLDKDLEERDVLSIASHVEIPEILLHNKIAERIVREIWESEYNIKASLFSSSSLHHLLWNYLHTNYDEEHGRRFYTGCREIKSFAPHRFQF